MRKKSLILLSAGLDSAANLAFCREFDQPILALTINYGQMAAMREIEAAKKLSDFYDVRHEVIEAPWLGRLGGNALTDSSRALPQPEINDLDQIDAAHKTAKAVWVPNRNGVLIHIASSYAESMSAEHVVVGFNREEAATFPDNSMEYLDCVNGALALSTSNGVKVHCYTGTLNKAEIVGELAKLKPAFPMGLIWSCYLGGDQPCGRCESCQRMTRALREQPA